MFERLSERLSAAFERLTRKGSLNAADVDEALRDVRVALLEADVALPVAKDFIAKVREGAIGEAVVKSVSPGQMVIKLAHDALIAMLKGDGTASAEIDLNAPAPVAILMLGLQGSGKTTTTAKLASRLRTQRGRKVLMASLDTRRPAAQQQLAVLGDQIGVATLPIVPNQSPVEIAERALKTARLEGFDAVLLDSAGRLAIDEELMTEMAAIHKVASPHESLLVADAMTGQDAVNIASAFKARVPVSGIVLTRIDGDARGGAALSMRAVAGCPIKLLGTGEKMEALEDFDAERIAGRILGMGDIVGLVEKAMEIAEQEDAEKLARKMQKGEFDLNDMAQQLRQVLKMGGLSAIASMLPGIGQIKKQIEGKTDDKAIRRSIAIISSMTPKERRHPDVIKASRKNRIARGAGVQVQEVNRLLKQHMDMARMMKQMGKLGQKGFMRSGLGGLLQGKAGALGNLSGTMPGGMPSGRR